MKKRNLGEGITEEGTPDMKYYAFDWDDNILEMPTQIMLIDERGSEVGMSTEDFAHYRSKVGLEPFDYKGKTIKGFAEDAFRNFKVSGDKQFLVDVMMAKEGPAWGDFLECVNGGSIFAIITARGHNPNTLKNGVYNMIISNYKGLDKKELLKNLKKYRDYVDEDNLTDVELIKDYLDMCKFYPVSYGNESGAQKPEELKIQAMEEFISYVKEMARFIKKKAIFKNDISNNFIPTIGFSDDDRKNIESMKKHFKEKQEDMLKIYSTAGGKKQKEDI
jgi:hypothetical protein